MTVLELEGNKKLSYLIIIVNTNYEHMNYFRSLPSPVMGLDVVRSNQVIWYILKVIFLWNIKYFLIEVFFSVKFEDPNYGDDYTFEAIRLQGVV